MNSFLAVAIGGAVGATLRFAISEVIQTPWGTFTVNIIGSLLLGICMAGLANELISSLSDKYKAFGCLRRGLYVSVLYKQNSTKIAGDYLGRLVLGEEGGTVKVFGATIF